MAYSCYHCGKQIKRGQVQLVVPPLFVTRLTGQATTAYHPACYEKAEREAGYELVKQPATTPKRATFSSTKTSQRVLLTGLDCLAGQNDLFTDIDGSK